MLESLPVYARWEVYKLAFAILMWIAGLILVAFHPWFKLKEDKAKQETPSDYGFSNNSKALHLSP